MEDETFKVRGSAATRQITATYAHSEGAAMQIVLQLSACHPLRALEVERLHNLSAYTTRTLALSSRLSLTRTQPRWSACSAWV